MQIILESRYQHLVSCIYLYGQCVSLYQLHVLKFRYNIFSSTETEVLFKFISSLGSSRQYTNLKEVQANAFEIHARIYPVIKREAHVDVSISKNILSKKT